MRHCAYNLDLRGCRSPAYLAQCRRRRVKCDEVQPRCEMCRLTRISCGGYEKKIFFDFERAPEDGVGRFRRPILTEEERETMSREMAACVQPSQAMWYIAKIDEECENTPELQELQVSCGPFGVFRIDPGLRCSSPASTPKATGVTRETPLQTGNNHRIDDYGDLDQSLFMPSDMDLVPTSDQVESTYDAVCQPPAQTMPDWNLLDTWGSFSHLDGDANWWQAPVERNCTQDILPENFLPDLQQALDAYPEIEEDTSPTLLSSGPSTTQDSISAVTSVPPSPNYAIPHEAIFLLRHYSSTVLKGLTPYRHTKTPWHILFIPHAKSCLAAMTLGESMDHAGLCAFSGMLAISASSLGVVSGSERWFAQSEACRNQARAHARLMLRTAYNVPKTAKYKSILMGLLTMVQISSAAGDAEERERYFLETEKFIRVKGLNRQKSRKVRLLHHCYVFERMLHETTIVGSEHSPLRCEVRRAIESCGARSFSRDSLSFKCIDWGNLEQDMRRIKGREEGENDLHLQFPGIWSGTLYAEIFGVPETYIFLLSLVVRLGHFKDEAIESSSAIGLKEYLSRAKSVEQCIQRLKKRPESVADAPTADLEKRDCQLILETLATAMLQALTIYFYRRVYDVDQSMLQPSVLAVRDCLRRFEAGSCGVGYGEARLGWPAYIAASEAEDVEVKREIETWFENCERRSGLRSGVGVRADRRGFGVERAAVLEVHG